MATDKKKISVYVDADLKERLEKLAKVEKRSVSNLLEKVAEEITNKAIEEGLIQ